MVVIRGQRAVKADTRGIPTRIYNLIRELKHFEAGSETPFL